MQMRTAPAKFHPLVYARAMGLLPLTGCCDRGIHAKPAVRGSFPASIEVSLLMPRSAAPAGGVCMGRPAGVYVDVRSDISRSIESTTDRHSPSPSTDRAAPAPPPGAWGRSSALASSRAFVSPPPAPASPATGCGLCRRSPKLRRAPRRRQGPVGILALRFPIRDLLRLPIVRSGSLPRQDPRHLIGPTHPRRNRKHQPILPNAPRIRLRGKPTRRASHPLLESVSARRYAREISSHSPPETPAERNPSTPRTDSPRCPAHTSNNTTCTHTPIARTAPSAASRRQILVCFPGTTFI